MTPWWRLPAFSPFLGFLRVTQAGERRHYYRRGAAPERSERLRFEFSPLAPGAVKRKALAFEAECCHCSKPMHPFRERRADWSTSPWRVRLTRPAVGVRRRPLLRTTSGAGGAVTGRYRPRRSSCDLVACR